MKILKIKHYKKTEKEDYVVIVFINTWGFKNMEVCIKPNWNINTYYAKSGKDIPIELWQVVEAFINTGDKIHEY